MLHMTIHEWKTKMPRKSVPVSQASAIFLGLVLMLLLGGCGGPARQAITPQTLAQMQALQPQ